MSSGSDRVLLWDGLVNGRELGGLPTGNGRIESRRLVRSASPHTLTAKGWQELVDYGIRTVIDLRHQWEIDEAPIPRRLRRSEVNVQLMPLEPPGYIESWSARDDKWKLATPHYLEEFLAGHALRVGEVLQAIADAAPGGVLVHCFSGRDRAGLTVAMLLDLLGVDHATITSDYWISFDRPQSIEAELGKAQAPVESPSNRTDDATVLTEILRNHPASSCFLDRAAADAARISLIERLCTTHGSLHPPKRSTTPNPTSVD